jgi:hypothetical protein
MKRWGRVTRAAALSFLMLFSLAAMLPLVISSAHNNESASASKKRSMRRHSRAWWRRYRARQRRRRAALERRKALEALRQSNNTDRQLTLDASSNPLSALAWPGPDSLGQSTPVFATEHGSRPAPMSVETGVRLNTPDGRTVGQVAVAVIAQASSNGAAASASAQRRALSGVPFAALRRTVIDRMLAAGGWVVNDFTREINGRRVYVVLAQTASPNDRHTPQQSWTFYFTEVEGRIYNIVSNAPIEFSDRMAVEAERVIATLGEANRSKDNSAQRR